MSVPPIVNVGAIEEALKPTGIPFFVGGKHITVHGAPPRFVVQWGSATVGPAKTVGGNPRQAFSDDWTLRVHCWGRTFVEAYRMRQALLMACRARLCGNFTVGATDVVSDEENVVDGHLMTVALTLSCPLYDARIGAIIEDARHRTGVADTIELVTWSIVGSPGAPAIDVTGDVHPSVHAVEVQITHGGPRGSARYTFKVNDGPWAPHAATAPSVVLERTGLVVAFPAATFVQGQRWQFSDTPTVQGDHRLDAMEG
jgi:hypothetical protein